MNLSSLLPVDAVTLLGGVAEQVADGLSAEAAAVGLGHLPAEDLVARAIVNWIKPLLAADGASGARPELLARRPPPAPPTNHDLAAALGACACWGEQPGCRICNERGAPGWTAIDRHLFGVYVQPALRRLRADIGSVPVPAPTNTRPIEAVRKARCR